MAAGLNGVGWVQLLPCRRVAGFSGAAPLRVPRNRGGSLRVNLGGGNGVVRSGRSPSPRVFPDALRHGQGDRRTPAPGLEAETGQRVLPPAPPDSDGRI